MNILATLITIDTCNFEYGFGIQGGAVYINPLDAISVIIKNSKFANNIA